MMADSDEMCTNVTTREVTIPPVSIQRAATLDGRLLCASESTYGIRSPYFRCASFLHGTTAKRITRSINSALIGQTTDGVVVAFRGTLRSSALDWFQNAAALFSPARGEKFQGLVHVGFYRAVKSLWDAMKGIVIDFLQASEKKALYITGHSKGGCLASIAALLMHFDPDLPTPTKVCVFGSARVGDATFREQYNKIIHQTTYENRLDIVPFLPPSRYIMEDMNENMTDVVESMLWPDKKDKQEDFVWGYQPLGKRCYIDEERNVVTEVTKDLDDSRIKEFEKATFLRFDVFVEAHRSDCKGGYFQAIAPEVCVAGGEM
uniref:Fungal lipase-type domain-containing protein n=1 Tax=Pseudictyota dubia TaxID=2749911 RepID=A0A7R9WHE4_9STRA|mmetsp:Transcript_48322/g.89600  ORF Transcript_48322/g.89600 Transcript_48322/m.89600 type:complete len:319 (+) Transcript_48322:181-1137(+)